jgi:hypothetical protein
MDERVAMAGGVDPSHRKAVEMMSAEGLTLAGVHILLERLVREIDSAWEFAVMAEVADRVGGPTGGETCRRPPG